MSYNDIMQKMFFYYPIYCRVKLPKNKRKGVSWGPGALEAGYALNQIEGSIDDPAARLMLYAAVLIFCAGREPEAANKAVFNDIHCLIEQYGIEKLLSQMPKADVKVVSADLQLLGVL